MKQEMTGRMKRSTMRWLLAWTLIAAMVLLAACGAAKTGGDKEPGNADGAAAAGTVYPYTITDATGEQLVFEQAPLKIVSLAPSETETIFAIGAGDLVVGVDAYSDYPAEATEIAQVGDYTTNIEAVMELEPDLVLASASMNTAAVEKLRELKLNVYATDPKTYDEVIAKIEAIGHIVNRQEQAGKVAGHMKETKRQIAEAVKDAARTKVYMEISEGWTVGSGEFLDELITLAGGSNVAASQPGWFEVNSEQVIADNPAVIVYPDFGGDDNPIVAGIQARPGWDAIDAVKNGRIIAVANDPVVRVGPRLADGLLALARAIHPDLVQP